MARTVDIVINSKASLAAMDAARKSLDDLKGAFGNISQISLGVGLERGFQALAQNIRETIGTANDFNSALENAQVGIASVLRTFQPEKVTTFAAALEMAGGAVDSLKERAKQSTATFGELLAAYQANAGNLFAAGVSNLEKQLDLVMAISSGASAFGLSTQQIAQEARALLTGNIGPDAQLARGLGISANDVKEWKAAGTVYEEVMRKLSAATEGATASAQTFTGQTSNLADAWEQLAAELGKPMFEEIKAGVAGLLGDLSDPEFREALRPLGENARDVAKAFFEATRFAAEHSAVIIQVGKSVGVLVTAVVAWKGLDLAAGIALITTRWLSEAAAIKSVTLALRENIAARERNALGQFVGGPPKPGSRAGMATGGLVAGLIGYEAGSMLEEAWNPLRALNRWATGDETKAVSGADARAMAARQSQYSAEMGEFQKQLGDVSDLKARDALIESTRKHMVELSGAMGEAQAGERSAIQAQLDGWQMSLQLVQRLTAERLKHRAAIRSEGDAIAGQLNEAKEQAKLEHQLTLAKGRGDKYLVETLEDEMARRQATASYEKAGFAPDVAAKMGQEVAEAIRAAARREEWAEHEQPEKHREERRGEAFSVDRFTRANLGAGFDPIGSSLREGNELLRQIRDRIPEGGWNTEYQPIVGAG